MAVRWAASARGAEARFDYVRLHDLFVCFLRPVHGGSAGELRAHAEACLAPGRTDSMLPWWAAGARGAEGREVGEEAGSQQPAASSQRTVEEAGAEAREEAGLGQGGIWRLAEFEPFGEEWIVDQILPGCRDDEAVVDQALNRPANRSRALDIGGAEEVAGVYALATMNRNRGQHLDLQRGQPPDGEGIVLPFPGEDDVKRLVNVGGGQPVATGAGLPECIANLLDVARGAARRRGNGVKGIAGEGAAAAGETATEKGVEVVSGYFADLKHRGAVVERTGGVEEDVEHAVADAAEEDVRRARVKLDARAHNGKHVFAVLDVHYVLELVEDHADLAAGGLGCKRVEDAVERARGLRLPRVDDNGGGSVTGIDGKRGAEAHQGLHDLGDPGISAIKAGQGRDKAIAQLRPAAHAEEIGVEQRHALHLADRLKDKGALSGAAGADDGDMLARQDMLAQAPLQFWAGAEEFIADGASVFERAHDLPNLSLDNLWVCYAR